MSATRLKFMTYGLQSILQKKKLSVLTSLFEH